MDCRHCGKVRLYFSKSVVVELSHLILNCLYSERCLTFSVVEGLLLDKVSSEAFKLIRTNTSTAALRWRAKFCTSSLSFKLSFVGFTLALYVLN